MSESPSGISNKRNLRRRYSSSPPLVKKNKSKSRSKCKYSSRSSSDRSRSQSFRKSDKHISSSKIRREFSRSRSCRNNRRTRKYYSRSKSPPRFTKYSRMKNENAEPCTCIGIFGLSKKTKEETLWNTFEKYGRIESLRLIMDREKRESLGYAFIDYKEIDSAKKAMKEAHGMDIDGNNIRLDYSVGKKPVNSRYFKDKSSTIGSRYESKYRNNGHRDIRKSRSSSRGSYRKRSSRSRRSRSSRGSYRRRRDSPKIKSRSKNSHGSKSSYKRRKISSKRRSYSRRSSNSRKSSR